LAVLRILRQVEREAIEALPPDYRPPAGKWLPGRNPRAVRLEGTGSRQDALRGVVEVFREDDDEDVAARSWLDRRVDDLGVERVAVLIGSHLIGFLPPDESKALARLVRRRKRRKVVWVDTFIEREDDEYIADVNLP
jgi:hypothetical protein